MKKLGLFFTAILVAMAAAQAQVLLADTAFTTDIGYNNARAGSICKPNGKSYGFDMHAPSQTGISDDFVVPPGTIWLLDTVVLYGYETGSSKVSPFTSAYLSINKDSMTGAQVLGNFSTNRLAASGWTGIYRVDTINGQTQDTTRPIMYLKLKISPALVLIPGTYWMNWSANGTIGSGRHCYCPPKVLPDRSNPTGQNGLQWDFSGWYDARDSVSAAALGAVGFNFILIGSTTTNVAYTRSLDMGLRLTPNPVQRQCQVSFTLAESSLVQVAVYDVSGRPVRTLLNERRTAGPQELSCDMSALPAGSYVYVVQTEQGRQSRLVQLVH